MKLVICGIAGRMGQALAQAARAGAHEFVGVDLTGPKLSEVIASRPHAVIDFTAPEASVEHARICAAAKIPMVIGTTGFSDAQREELSRLGEKSALVVAPNMSVGVNVVIGLCSELARRLGPEFDVEIVEAHHKKKKDAPSGTALRLAEEIALGTGRTSSGFRTAREGQVGERPGRGIGIQNGRGGGGAGGSTD